jgi:hypothetical protein
MMVYEENRNLCLLAAEDVKGEIIRKRKGFGKEELFLYSLPKGDKNMEGFTLKKYLIRKRFREAEGHSSVSQLFWNAAKDRKS